MSRAMASAVSLWSPVTITLLRPAPFATLIASLTSGRAGSIMPSSPTNTRSRSISSGFGLAGTCAQRPVGDAQHAQRGARHLEVLIEHLLALARRVSGTACPASWMWVQRSRSTSGAPFTKAMKSAPSRRWIVVMRLRSESNGISCTRGQRLLQLARREPALRRGDHHGALGGIAHHAPRAPAGASSSSSLRVVAEHRALQQHGRVRVVGGSTLSPSRENCPSGRSLRRSA